MPDVLDQLLEEWDGTFFRGTQRATIKGVRKGLSFTPSLPVAVIWSAVPGDVWARTKAHFVEGSTVHEAQLNLRNPLLLSSGSTTSLARVIEALRFEYVGGIDEAEARKVFNYLHNRLVGKAKGGDFKYRLLDESYDEIEDPDEMLPFSFLSPHTPISYLARDWWDDAPTVDTAHRLLADTFIFADAPAIQRAALDQGYDALVYPDVFAGGESASLELLGCPVWDLVGVEEELDIDDEYVPTHWTVRLLDPEIVESTTGAPTVDIVESVDLCKVNA